METLTRSLTSNSASAAVGSGNARAEAIVTVPSGYTPSGDTLMCALGFGSSGSVTSGIGLYSDGTFRTIGGGPGEMVSLGQAYPQSGNVLAAGTFTMQAVRIGSTVHVSFKFNGSDLAPKSVGRSFADSGGTFVSVVSPALPAGFSVGEFSTRDDLSCYSDASYQKRLRLAPVFAGGTDAAWIEVPSDHSLTGPPATVYGWSHAFYNSSASPVYDYFQDGTTMTTVLAAGYIACYVDGRPQEHWGNEATVAQMEAARQWIAANLNGSGSIALYGASMGGAFALSYTNFHAEHIQAVATDVPAVDIEFMRDERWFTNVDASWGGAGAVSDGNPASAANAPHFAGCNIKIEAGANDTTCPPAMIQAFVDGITPYGANVDYSVVDKGHAQSITAAEQIAYFDLFAEAVYTDFDLIASQVPPVVQVATYTDFDLIAKPVTLAAYTDFDLLAVEEIRPGDYHVVLDSDGDIHPTLASRDSGYARVGGS